MPVVKVSFCSDGCDAETDGRVRTRCRLRYAAPNASVRGLLSHARDACEEWGVVGLLVFSSGARGREFSLSVRSSPGRDEGPE